MQTLLHSVPSSLQQATADPRLHWKLLDTHGKVWVSLLWGHCSFLLGPGAHKVLFVPSKSLFPQSCVSSGHPMVVGSGGGVNGNLLQKGLCHNQVYCKKAKCLYEETLQIAMKRREAKGKGEKETNTHLNVEFQRRARRDKDFLLIRAMEKTLAPHSSTLAWKIPWMEEPGRL